MSYKRIGNYVQLVDNRNKDLAVTNLLGVNITKKIMPSVANTSESDLSKYKIIQKGQFAYSAMQVGRDETIRLALYEGEQPAIISPAYLVIRSKDINELLPEYLMMWFTRSEFDREACFHAVGGVRESLEWDDFENLQLPIPHPDKQKEIVKEYNTIVNRIALNNQLIKKLEETTQAIYRQWFVDFEFPFGFAQGKPNEEGKPYKSNGGEMVESELGKIPKGWRKGSLNEIVNVIDGDRGTNYPSIEDMSKTGFCLFLNAGNISKTGFVFTENTFITKEKDNELRKGKLTQDDVVITTRGTVGNVGYFSDKIFFSDIRINSGMVILRGREIVEATIFVYSMLRNSDIKIAIVNYLSGSAQPQLPIRDLIKIPILIPENDLLISFSKIAFKIQQNIDVLKIQNLKLNELRNLLLSKLATIEN